MELFLYIDPLKQGLKHKGDNAVIIFIIVFIHRSIKTRIETIFQSVGHFIILLFLYIDPLKQGLKLGENSQRTPRKVMFLYIDPLKQGLKQHYELCYHFCD